MTGARWLADASGAAMPTFDWTYTPSSAEVLPRTIRRERSPTGETGMCTTNGALYLDPTSTRLAGLAAHELGHCELGLADDFESEGIMHVLEPRRWTEREEGQCRASSLCRR